MTPQTASLFAEYNRWMNDRLYAAAATLDPAALTADKGAFFGSILGTLNHIAVADTIWLHRFAQHEAASPPLGALSGFPRPSSLTQPLRAIAFTCHPHPRIFEQHSATLKPVHTQQLAQAPCELYLKGVYSRLLDDEHGNARTDAVDELPLPGRRPSPCRLCAPA